LYEKKGSHWAEAAGHFYGYRLYARDLEYPFSLCLAFLHVEGLLYSFLAGI